MKKGWLKNAFAVDPPGPAEPNEAQQRTIDWLCDQVVKRRLTLPTLMGLELARPLNYIGANAMHVFSPTLWAIVREQTHENYQEFARFLEQRGSIEYICARMEEANEEYQRRGRADADAEHHDPGAPSAGPDVLDDHGQDDRS